MNKQDLLKHHMTLLWEDMLCHAKLSMKHVELAKTAKMYDQIDICNININMASKFMNELKSYHSDFYKICDGECKEEMKTSMFYPVIKATIGWFNTINEEIENLKK